jgi:hypothetical protein
MAEIMRLSKSKVVNHKAAIRKGASQITGNPAVRIMAMVADSSVNRIQRQQQCDRIVENQVTRRCHLSIGCNRWTSIWTICDEIHGK